MLKILEFVFVFALGTVAGSFIGALSYRYPRGISILQGRSFCPMCKTQIAFYDNIPLLSFIFLRGKCRRCGGNITLREPIIELSAGMVLTMLYFGIGNSLMFVSGVLGNFKLNGSNNYILLAFLFIVFTMFITIFVIDFENSIIPDLFTFFIFILVLGLIMITDSPSLFSNLFISFTLATFFLILHLVTRGKGMGLGDVKLALPIGLILGRMYSLQWLSLSFILGGIVATTLLLSRKTSLKNRIAFGPFMITAFIIIYLFGDSIIKIVRFF